MIVWLFIALLTCLIGFYFWDARKSDNERH